jgi:hypothetical protein
MYSDTVFSSFSLGKEESLVEPGNCQARVEEERMLCVTQIWYCLYGMSVTLFRSWRKHEEADDSAQKKQFSTESEAPDSSNSIERFILQRALVEEWRWYQTM